MEVVSQSFSQYQSSLAGYNYDLYIGETRLMDNMDFSLLLNGGALGYAAPYSEYLSDLARAYRATGTRRGDALRGVLRPDALHPACLPAGGGLVRTGLPGGNPCNGAGYFL